MGCWHTYAKLELHTEHTLKSFEQVTVDLGILLREFASNCDHIETMELPRERQARVRAATKKGTSGTSQGGSRPKKFSLGTYKLHALGDYPQTIRERGTTDNYTTQWVGIQKVESCTYGIATQSVLRSRLPIAPQSDSIPTPINMNPTETSPSEYVVLKS